MKILIVEDDEKVARFLMESLRGEGYDVQHETDGFKAFSEIQVNSFDLIILDLLLPNLSGEELLKKIRIQRNSVPVIILSAVQDTDSKTHLLNLGADDYLEKPFSFVELMARIQSILRRSMRYQKSDEIKIGDLKIIPKMRTVYSGSQPIQLRVKEYDLLQYLIQHPNRVISRSTLIEQVWDYNTRITSNTVDSHISLLRKKINRYSKQNPIKTMQGMGYVFLIE